MRVRRCAGALGEGAGAGEDFVGDELVLLGDCDSSALDARDPLSVGVLLEAVECDPLSVGAVLEAVECDPLSVGALLEAVE